MKIIFNKFKSTWHKNKPMRLYGSRNLFWERPFQVFKKNKLVPNFVQHKKAADSCLGGGSTTKLDSVCLPP